jgi:hypothetical protein
MIVALMIAAHLMAGCLMTFMMLNCLIAVMAYLNAAQK